MKQREESRTCERCNRIPKQVASRDPFLCRSCHSTIRRRQGYQTPARQCIDCGELRPLGGKGRCKPCYDRKLRKDLAEQEGRIYRSAGVPRGRKVTAIDPAPAKSAQAPT